AGRRVRGAARHGRVARRGRPALRVVRPRGAPPHVGRDQEPRRAVLRGPGARAGAHGPGGTSHQRVPPPRPGAARGLLLVPAALALGGKRPAVRIAAGRGARARGYSPGGVAHRRVARARARPARHPRRALGPPVVSYTRRGDVLEGPRAPGAPPGPRHPAAADRNVIDEAPQAPQAPQAPEAPAPVGHVVATELKP